MSIVAYWNVLPKDFYSGKSMESPIVTDTGQRIDFNGVAFVDEIEQKSDADGIYPAKVTLTIARRFA